MSHLTDYSYKVIEANSSTTETKFFCRDEDCIIVDTLQVPDVFNKEVGLCRQTDASDNALPDCYTQIHQESTSPFVSLTAVDTPNSLTSRAELTSTGVKLSSCNDGCCSCVNLSQNTMCLWSSCGPVSVCSSGGVYAKPSIVNGSLMCDARMLIEPYQFGFEMEVCNCDTGDYCSGSWFYLINRNFTSNVKDNATNSCSCLVAEGSTSQSAVETPNYSSYLTVDKYNSTVFSVGCNTETAFFGLNVDKSGDNCCITALNSEIVSSSSGASLSLCEQGVYFRRNSGSTGAGICLHCDPNDGLGISYAGVTCDSSIVINCTSTSVQAATVTFCVSGECQLGQTPIHNCLSAPVIGLGSTVDFTGGSWLIGDTSTTPGFYPKCLPTYTGVIHLPTGTLSGDSTYMSSPINCYCVISGIIRCQL